MSVTFEMTTDVRRVDMESLAALYASVGFGTEENYRHPAMTLNRLFGAGVYGFFAFQGERLVGMARVLSDDVMCSWIAELCVHPDCQRRGIGGALLDRVNERFRDTALYADAFKGQEGFLRSRGIVPQSRLVTCGRAPMKSD
ncbi:MAG: GNAT family N-acetyltransferase [Magnetospirillum sp. WYHS-4]